MQKVHLLAQLRHDEQDRIMDMMVQQARQQAAICSLELQSVTWQGGAGNNVILDTEAALVAFPWCCSTWTSGFPESRISNSSVLAWSLTYKSMPARM